MISYDPKTKTVTMDLVDLEHCGFDHDEYKSELFLAGLSDIDPALQWPEFLVVNFVGGAVKTCGPTPDAPDGVTAPLEDSPFDTGIRRGAVIRPPRR